MNCSPTLTSDEFKTIHNALCDLDSVVSRLEDVLKPELYVKLAKTATDIRKGLKGAYDQDNKAFDRMYKMSEEAMKKINASSVWSIYDIKDFNDLHPFSGAEMILYKDHWGGKPAGAKIQGNTWLDLYRAADLCIKESGDNHHMFIEALTPMNPDNLVLVLSTGS